MKKSSKHTRHSGKGLSWGLSIIMFLFALVLFPSLSSVLLLLGGVLALPVRLLRDILSAKGLKPGVSVALACALFIGAVVVSPDSKKATESDDAPTRGVVAAMAALPTSADTEKSEVDPVEMSATKDPRIESSAPTDEPDATPDSTPEESVQPSTSIPETAEDFAPEPVEVPAAGPVPEPLEEPTQPTAPEPPAQEAPTPSKIRGRSPDTIVYVSDRSHTIHSVSNCSGMKNYSEMTIERADAKGYKYCPTCW